jgi:hypothetical protein
MGKKKEWERERKAEGGRSIDILAHTYMHRTE